MKSAVNQATEKLIEEYLRKHPGVFKRIAAAGSFRAEEEAAKKAAIREKALAKYRAKRAKKTKKA